MPVFDLHTALGWLSTGRLLGDPATLITGVCTDTRSLTPGSLFVALRGERFDAHAFIDQARAGGAAAVLYDDPNHPVPAPALWAPDARRALGEIAGGWR
jgi:UDP-N-acetylmuramoyl-tripeptide--D-alanyl-D-alanine ligase